MEPLFILYHLQTPQSVTKIVADPGIQERGEGDAPGELNFLWSEDCFFFFGPFTHTFFCSESRE